MAAAAQRASLAGKRILITGASRGIGLSIALRAARDGAKVCVAAKTTDPHPRLPGTIFEAAEKIRAAGGEALPVACDIRDEAQVKAAVDAAVKAFGGLDILVNNASAISNTPTLETDMKRFDLMHQINSRGTFLVTKTALPHLLETKKSGGNPHVMMLSPPLNMDPKWFELAGTAYTIAKYNMSMCVLGMSEEFKGQVAFNALWPRTGIATAAINMLAGTAGMMASRKPEIMADAAHWILSQPVSCTGNFFIDDEVIVQHAKVPKMYLADYAVQPGVPLMPDFYVGSVDEMKKWMAVGEAAKSVGDVAKKIGSLFGRK